MPADLSGKAAATPDGRRLCFGYNLGTCRSNTKDGQRCNRGFHLCCNPGCFGPHPLAKCTRGASTNGTA
jgi:hypothetical protein